MKKWKIVLLCILGAVAAAVIAVAAVAIWQRDNIKAVYTVMTSDSETIARELEEQREQHRQELEDRAQIEVAPPTSQQTNDVLSGSATPQEVKEQLGISELLEKGKAAGIIPDDTPPPGEGEKEPDSPGISEPPTGDTAQSDTQGQTAAPTDAPENANPPDAPPVEAPPTGEAPPGGNSPETGAPAPSGTTAGTPKPPEKGDTTPPDAAAKPPDKPARPAPEDPPELTADELVNICVAELYSCQVDIMDTLRVLKEEARSQWISLPPSEQTDARMREIGLAGLDRCYELEVETDNKVMEILDRYRPLLKDRGADTSILDVLWEQYVEEKSAEKAYYLDKYMN